MATTISVESAALSSSLSCDDQRVILHVPSGQRATTQVSVGQPITVALNEEMESPTMSSLPDDTQRERVVAVIRDDEDELLYAPYPFHQQSKEEVDDFHQLMTMELSFDADEDWSVADEVSCCGMSVDTDDEVSFYCDDNDPFPLSTPFWDIDAPTTLHVPTPLRPH